jgi:hypothetical protein
VKKIIVGLAAVVVLCGGIAQAQNDSGFGIGIVAGEPTGLCGKVWMSQSTAFAGAAAWTFKEEAAVTLQLDYLYHNFNVIKVEKGRLPLYYGIGGRVKLEEDSRIGLRIPVGLDYLFVGAPLDVFIEIVPVLDLAPDTEFNLNGGIGVRYFF